MLSVGGIRHNRILWLYGVFRHALEKLNTTIDEFVSTTDTALAPYRKSAFKRFPITFTLLVALGVVSISVGVEILVYQISWFHEHPTILIGLGTSVLIVTGMFYKKLG